MMDDQQIRLSGHGLAYCLEGEIHGGDDAVHLPSIGQVKTIERPVVIGDVGYVKGLVEKLAQVAK